MTNEELFELVKSHFKELVKSHFNIKKDELLILQVMI
jgi:hypothetical protein